MYLCHLYFKEDYFYESYCILVESTMKLQFVQYLEICDKKLLASRKFSIQLHFMNFKSFSYICITIHAMWHTIVKNLLTVILCQ